MRFCSSLQKDSDSQQYPPGISRTMSFASRETNDRFEASNDNEYGNRKGTKDRFEASNEAGNTAKRILEAINETPDSNTEYLSRKLGLSRSTV